MGLRRVTTLVPWLVAFLVALGMTLVPAARALTHQDSTPRRGGPFIVRSARADVAATRTRAASRLRVETTRDARAHRRGARLAHRRGMPLARRRPSTRRAPLVRRTARSARHRRDAPPSGLPAAEAGALARRSAPRAPGALRPRTTLLLPVDLDRTCPGRQFRRRRVPGRACRVHPRAGRSPARPTSRSRS
jgi:hypothetical protein